MGLYRKKPIEIEAIQYNGSNGKIIEAFIEGNFDNTLNYPNIITLEGTMTVSINDFVIKGVQGEFYACKPDIFKLTYEKVNE